MYHATEGSAITYVHECPQHGEFELCYSMKDSEREKPCPECGTASRKLLRVSVGQMFVPAHFRTTLPTTGLKNGQGQSGEFENLKHDFNRWDSGASGMRENPKHLKRGGSAIGI